MAILVLQVVILAGLGFWFYTHLKERAYEAGGPESPHASSVTRSDSDRLVHAAHPPAAAHGPADDWFAMSPIAGSRDPFEQMDRMFDNALTQFRRMDAMMDMEQGWDRLGRSPTIDMKATGACYAVTLSLPGVETTNVTVSINGRMLTISGRSLATGPGSTSMRSFERRILLPGPVGDLARAQAQVSNNVLHITIPHGGQDTAGPGGRKLL